MSADLIPDLPAEDYHRLPALSRSQAWKLVPPSTPAHFRWYCDNPEPSTDAFDFGSAAHTLVLGTGDPIAVIEADDWRTKAAREARDVARDAGAIPLLPKDYDRVKALADAVKAHAVAGSLLAGGAAEQSVTWTDERGIERRCRFDYLPGKVPAVVDFKTTVSADLASFGKSAANFGYAFQAVFYLEAAAAAGIPAEGFIFIAAEKEPPHLVSVTQLSDRALDLGRAQLDRALDLYLHCTETGQWPGYSDDLELLDLPEWAYREAS